MKAKAFLLLAAMFSVLALGVHAIIEADFPGHPGSGQVMKASGAGSVADPAIPHVVLSGSGTINGTVTLTAGTIITVTNAAGEAHIGQVGGPGVVLSLTPTLDTTTYADNETLFSTSLLAAATRTSGGRAYVQNLIVLDEDDQGVGLDVLFLSTSTTIGATNSAVAITDTNARNIIGRVSITTSDYYDLGGSKVAVVPVGGLMLQASGTTAIWAAGVSRGAGTYTASGLKLQIGLIQD